jgi:multidrug resistance efflux pump
MFIRSVNSIVANIQKQIDLLKLTANTRADEAEYHKAKRDEAFNEYERASRLAARFTDLIS